MQPEIKRYPVQHPLLKKYIRFFWELRIARATINHKIVPQRNINLRFNLSDTSQYIDLEGTLYLQEKVFFSGLQDHFRNAYLKLDGNVDVMGICFYPEGFYPFIKIPVSEFRNLFVGASEVGFKPAHTINEKLINTGNTSERLTILESELIRILKSENDIPENFRKLFYELRQSENPQQITEFCMRNDLTMRSLERMFNKYVGVSANTYGTLNRFHKSLNQLLQNDYSKLSDLAYENGYFDQMHFIRDFKRFAGNTPKNFVHQGNSILQIGKLN